MKSKREETKSETRLSLRDKIAFACFMENLGQFKDLWKRTAETKPFDEFLAETVREKPNGIKGAQKALLKAFAGCVPKIIVIWRESGSKEPFEKYLDGVAEAHSERINKKIKKEVRNK